MKLVPLAAATALLSSVIALGVSSGALLAGCELASASRAQPPERQAEIHVDLPAGAAHAEPTLASTGLARHSLAGSSFATLQLVATPHGRAVLSTAVACALPLGATLTLINRDGAPFSFAGSLGLAAAWESRPLDAAERERVSACVDAVRARQA